jgi:multidrug resistance efflux pump
VDIPRFPPRTKKIRALAGPIAIATLAIVVGLVATLLRPGTAAATVPRASVWTEHVHKGTLMRQVAAHGTLVPEHVRWLSAGAAARVARIPVRAGAVVDPDTVVITLENPELDLAALEAERQAASAESALIQLRVKAADTERTAASTLLALRLDLEVAVAHAQMAERLAPEGLITEIDRKDAETKKSVLLRRIEVEEARTRLLAEGQRAEVAAAQVELDRLRQIAAFRQSQLAALEVRAGIHGVVQDVPLENGQWVAIGSVLAKVAEPDRLKAELKVAEGDAKDVHRGLSVRFEDGVEFRGQVERVDPAVVAGAVKVIVTLDGPLPKGARADQSVSGVIEIERLEDVLFVARPAGVQEDSLVALFRLEKDHVHASRVTARLGRGSARDVQILAGLDEGDEIVVSDSSAWEAQDKIRLQ